jgi:hypothetical protein
LKLEIPETVVMPDGTTAIVRGVTANVINGGLDQIVYTVEKASGAWAEVAMQDVHVEPLLK